MHTAHRNDIQNEQSGAAILAARLGSFEGPQPAPAQGSPALTVETVSRRSVAQTEMEKYFEPDLDAFLVAPAALVHEANRAFEAWVHTCPNGRPARDAGDRILHKVALAAANACRAAAVRRA